mmetsp:Transcript_13773/g.27865  ORF Transcript_13773/g.27865 Transcript_13773/m.27865 type:complete len:141 (-) Transcript_13773:608-1030(-)
MLKDKQQSQPKSTLSGRDNAKDGGEHKSTAVAATTTDTTKKDEVRETGSILNKCIVVLVRTSGPMNLGQICRVAHNLGVGKEQACRPAVPAQLQRSEKIRCALEGYTSGRRSLQDCGGGSSGLFVRHRHMWEGTQLSHGA